MLPNVVEVNKNGTNLKIKKNQVPHLLNDKSHYFSKKKVIIFFIFYLKRTKAMHAVSNF
jgi:hypothetical protein